MSNATLDFLVKRDDLRTTEFVRGNDAPQVDLAPGEAQLAIDQFALTANNITYAAFGDAMAYWQFFPARPGFGRIPVWGFADVARSRHERLREGERIYGYFPMSSHLSVRVDRVSDGGFVDAAPHRAKLPPVYNQYTRLGAEHRAELEDAQMLFRPLFMTSFVIDDFLARRELFGARQIVLSSASSKTSLSLAFLLSRRAAPRAEVVGLTSPAHRAFVQRAGCYDRVAGYDEVGSLARSPAVYVDMAGNARVLAAVHAHFANELKHSCLVGATHWEARGGGASDALLGPKPERFFAPDHIRAAIQALGAQAFSERVETSWRPFVESARGWITPSRHRGPDAVRAAYLEVLDNRARPDTGYVLSLRA
ncbi:MAG TPA: DUF2855 family protein [Myxococcota bacterium]|nr:DUF2855 family protein [Myxococcota bacterium]